MEKWKIGAIVGATWAIFSALGFSHFYSSVGKAPVSLWYKVLFFYVLLLDSVIKKISANFSLPYSLVYFYRADFLTFLFLLVYLGLIGAAVGGEIIYLLDSLFQRIKSAQKK